MLQYYKLRPLPVGCQVLDLDLSNPITEETITQLQRDLEEYKLLVFRDQHWLTPARHIEVSKWFGSSQLESTFCNHRKSPSNNILRVSNDEREGCTHVALRGCSWHMDGSFMPEPFSHSLYHYIKVPSCGSHDFVDMSSVISCLAKSNMADILNRLWMVSDSLTDAVHPLIYTHPTTGQLTMCFHLDMIDSFILDYGSPAARKLTAQESRLILQHLNEAIEKSAKYNHYYRPGDFIIADNLAVANKMSQEEHWHRDRVGLAIMHRTTVAGVFKPTKQPSRNIVPLKEECIEPNYKLFKLAEVCSELKEAFQDNCKSMEYNFIRSAG